MNTMKTKKQSICPISREPKPRRYAVAASVWKNATGAQKAYWEANAMAYAKAKRPSADRTSHYGSLRRMMTR
jgi:hypothetical protein